MLVLYHSRLSLCSLFYRIMLLFLHFEKVTIVPPHPSFTHKQGLSSVSFGWKMKVCVWCYNIATSFVQRSVCVVVVSVVSAVNCGMRLL